MTQVTKGPVKACILVVDDNEANRDLLSRRLRKKGFAVELAASVPQALEAVSRVEFDLVLLDIMMPGMDGFEVLSRIRAERSSLELPVILATAMDDSKDVIQGLEAGANDYVTKPFDFPVVMARVATQLALSSTQRELRAAHDRMKRDLGAAARVQRALLPEEAPIGDGYSFAWRYHPCDELAGDALNIRKFDEDRIGFHLLDVSGHGVPSALLSVSVSHSLLPSADPASVVTRPSAEPPGYAIEPPVSVAERLNALYPMMVNDGLYFTMIYAILDVREKSLTLVAAGHPPPLIVGKDGSWRMIGDPGTPIGILPKGDFTETVIRLSPGDRVYLYSDGVTEAEDSAEEFYGEARMVDVLSRSRSLPLGDGLDALVEDVKAWRGNDGFDDDVSLLALELRGISP